VGPSTIFSTAGSKTVISGGPVVLDVYIASEDVDGMNSDLGDPTIPENRRRMGYVEFTISSANGFGPMRSKVYLPVTGEPDHYRYTWNNATALEGVYLFEGRRRRRYAAEGASRVGGVRDLAVGAARPTGLSATTSDATLYLTWDPSPAGDLNHYELYRGLDGTTFTILADDLPATSYTDSGLTNDTAYYYYVCAVDNDGNRSAPSTTLSAIRGPPPTRPRRRCPPA